MASYPPPRPGGPQFSPNAEQLAREKALRRFNRLILYLPLGIAILIAVVLMALFLIAALTASTIMDVVFISALADIILILGILPMLVMLAILPLAYIGYLINRRQRRKLNPQTGPLANHSRIQVYLWRLDRFIDKSREKTEETAPKVAKPFIKGNAFLAYLESWPNMLKEQSRLRQQDDATE